MSLKYLVISAGCMGLAACGPVKDPSDLTGMKAPDFEVQTLQSEAIKTSLASYKGKPVIIDFWATWCGPCRMLSPRVEKIYKDFKSKGLAAMAITDENRHDVQKFEARTPHDLPVFIDQNDIATNAFHVTGLPTVIVVDKNGSVIYDEVGFVGNQLDLADEAMRAAVKKALGPT